MIPEPPTTHPGIAAVSPSEKEPLPDGTDARNPAPARRVTPPEHGVLEAFRRREPAALEAFFDHYFDLVFGLVFRLLGNRAAAEDVTQEVFYKVYRAAERLDLARDPAPWIAAIAYNACRDLWRSVPQRIARHSGSIDDAGLAETLTRGTNDPERDALAGERERLVQAAIAELPEQLRAPVVLHDYQGLSHQEIAELLGIEHAAARKRYSRALAALGGRLKDTLGS